MQDERSDRLDAFAELLAIIDRLREPDGCPWDREQTQQSMTPHLLEECYEAIEAVQSGDPAASCEELGDVLMNVLMIARIASESPTEAKRFDAGAVASGIASKLVRRHPHVFGDVEATDSNAVLANWEQIKLAEKREAASRDADEAATPPKKGVLDGLPADLPALHKAFRIGEKVSRVGFDWPDAVGPREKVQEELAELDEAIASGCQESIEGEVGDLLFAVANLARHHGVQPEMALRSTNARFRARFGFVESELDDRLGKANLEEMDSLWDEAKRRGIGTIATDQSPSSGLPSEAGGDPSTD